jgi:hypothetical protein
LEGSLLAVGERHLARPTRHEHRFVDYCLSAVERLPRPVVRLGVPGPGGGLLEKSGNKS